VAPAQPLPDAPAEMMPRAQHDLMLDVAVADGTLVAVGDRGQILLSKDGKTWTQSKVPTRATLTAVYFTDAKNGWAVGHDAVILHTADGGVSWTKQYYKPDLEKPFLDVAFLDSQRGFAVGAYGLFMQTADGGGSWTEVQSDIRADEWHFNAITKLNDGSLLIAGEAGGLAHSKDGGATWAKLPAPYQGSFFGALPKGEKGAITFGLRGNLYMTNDVASGSWQKVETQTVLGLMGGVTLPSGEVVMVGNNGIALETSGGMSSVKHLANPVGISLSSVVPFGGKLVAVGEGGTQTLSP
jgi:photosystem II stability/assembly factor-like uncharacterized protein